MWNIFFADSRFGIEDAGFEASIFADDLKAFRGVLGGTEQSTVFEALRKCQEKVHVWGVANQVSFDKTKEHFAILHARKNVGGNFKLLGVVFDTHLEMEKMACEMAAQGHSRISMIMRCPNSSNVPRNGVRVKSIRPSTRKSVGGVRYFRNRCFSKTCVGTVALPT